MPGDDGPVDFLPAATREPDRLALTDGERSWSYGALAASADRVDSEVLRLDRARVPVGAEATEDVRPVVATLLPPSPEAVVVTHAVLRSGALLAPLHPGLTGPELSDALDALGPACLVASPGTVELARSASAGASAPEVIRVERMEPRAAAGPARPCTVPADREVAVLWTSGTSGRPRGVVLRASSLRHGAEASRARLGLRSDDRWYASLSLAHVGGLALVTRAGLLGSALVAQGGFDLRTLNAAIDGGEVTHASLVPTMLARLLDARGAARPAEAFGLLLVGGAHCPPELVDRAFRAHLPVALTYGMTEATSQVATAPPATARANPRTVGRPLQGVELRIGSATDAKGEILVRGPTLAARLWDGGALVDAEGWYHTGDLGRLDDDGRLSVTGRRSARIVTGGVTVDPLEIEGVLRALDGVSDAAVVGVPDAEWGEAVWAAVVPAEGGDRGAAAAAGPSAPEPRVLGEEERVTDESRLRAQARRRLAAPKVPKRVLELSSLPVNANGKVDRAALRELLVRSTSVPRAGGPGRRDPRDRR